MSEAGLSVWAQYGSDVLEPFLHGRVGLSAWYRKDRISVDGAWGPSLIVERDGTTYGGLYVLLPDLGVATAGRMASVAAAGVAIRF